MNEPATVVEIDRDVCSRTFGVSPCLATGTKCYNTWATCVYTSAYDATVQTIRFVKPRADIPLSWQAVPSLQSVSSAPTELNVGDVDATSGPLGKRAQASITLVDHPTSDILLDPYVSTRGVNPMEIGTFWGRLNARWPYHKGRALRVLTGDITDALSAMTVREYLIDSIDGPDAGGRVSIKAVDPLRLLDDKTAQAPVQSSGRLQAAITADQTSLVISGIVTSSANLLAYTESLWDQSYWQVADTLAGFFTAADSYDVRNPSGTSGGVTKFIATATPDILFLRRNQTFTFGAKAVSLYVYVPAQTGITGWSLTCDFQDAETSSVSSSTVFDAWVRVTLASVTLASSRGFVDFNIRSNGGTPAAGFTFYATRAQITSGSTHATYTPGSTDYPGAGTIRIGSELMRYAGYTVTDGTSITLSGLTRGSDGSTAASHSTDDRVQACLRYEDINAWQIADSLIATYAPSAYAYVDTAQWQTEAERWLDGFIGSSVISEPTGINALLAELCRDAQFFIWWDERQAKILLRSMRPPTETPASLDDNAHIISGSQSLQRKADERISQIWYYYGPADASKSVTDEANYRNVRIRIDSAAETTREYGEVAVKRIYSRWVRKDGIVTSITTRLLNRYRDVPFYLTLSVDRKDGALWTGDVVDVATRLITDTAGAPASVRYQIISADDGGDNGVVKYTMQDYQLTAKYGYYMSSSAPIYSLATPAEKLTGAWYADSNGLISGDAGYQYQ